MSKPEDKQNARETAERSEVEQKKQTLLYHLNALRKVLVVSAGAVLGLKPLETSGYHAMGQSRGAAATAWALGAVSVGLGVLVSGWGFLPPAMAIFVAAVTAFSLRRNLGGMCGDISGAAITLGELAGSAALLLL